MVVAVLARLGGKKGEPGLFAYSSTPAQNDLIAGG
jgi:hypothetical protein